MATHLGTTALNSDAGPQFAAPAVDSKVLPFIQSDERYAQSPSRKHVSILLVDDNPADVLLVREALKWHEVNSDLIVARDGDDAIRLMDEIDSKLLQCPDLVILDLNLPRKTGFEVLQRIRTSPCCGETPVIILSSSDAQSDRQKAKLLGASQYLQKPSNLHDFMSIGATLKDMLASAA
jgi:chemotaxis family two-component system response regulator Rcp1